jgi:hypothetical protein
MSSLRVIQDAVLYSALLDTGNHVTHGLAAGRMAWLHVAKGEVRLEDLRLRPGDGAGLSSVPAVSFTAHTTSEVLLIELHDPATAGSSGRVSDEHRHDGRVNVGATPLRFEAPTRTGSKQHDERSREKAGTMGDKSPKAKAKAKKQEEAAKEQKKAAAKVDANHGSNGAIVTKNG